MNFKTFAYSVLDKRIERATGFETAWGRVVYNDSTLNVPDLATERRRMWQDRIRNLEYARTLVEGAGQRLEPVMTALDAIVKSYPTIEDIIVNYARNRSYGKN